MRRIDPQPGRSASQITTRWWWITAALFLGIGLHTAACDCEGDTPGPAGAVLFAPTLSGAPPMETTEATLSLAGGKSPGVGVGVALNGADVEISQPTSINQWSGSITLTEGDNQFTLYAFNGAGGRSAPGLTYNVRLDSTAPAAPSLAQEPPACVPSDELTLNGTVEAGATLYVNGEAYPANDDGSFELKIPLSGANSSLSLYAEDALGNRSEEKSYSFRSGVATPTLEPVSSPTGERFQRLRGSKEPGVGVVLRLDGEADGTTIVPANESATWEYEIELTNNTTTFYIDGVAGDRKGCAEAGPFEIIFSDVCPPTVNRDGLPLGMTIAEPDTLSLSITRCEGVTTWLRRDDEGLDGGTRLDADGDGLTFTAQVQLQEGTNVLWVYNRLGDLPSPQDGPFEVTLDRVAPAAPEITSPDNNTQTLTPTATITGTREVGTSLCMIRSPNLNCEVTLPLSPMGDFSLADVQLNLGDNTFSFYATDAAGNQSQEARLTVVRLNDDTPTVQLINPVNNALVGPGPLQIQARINAARDITTHMICFDSDCGMGQIVGDLYSRTVTVPENLLNGSDHTVRVTATNDIGQTGEATAGVLFINGGLPLSTTTPETPSRTAKLALDGDGRLHAFWSDDCSGVEGCEVTADNIIPGDILHRVLDNQVWGPVERVSSDVNDGDSRSPDVAADAEGNLHLVWTDDGNIDGFGGDLDVYYRQYDLASDTWGPVQTVSVGEEDASQEPAVAVTSDGSVHVVWETTDGQLGTIRYARRNNNGQWTMPASLSDTNAARDARLPDITADPQDRLYVVWQEDFSPDRFTFDNDILLTVAEDNNFGPRVVVSDNILDGDSRLPQIVSDSQSRIHIAWRDTSTIFNSGENDDIFHRVYTHSDQNFTDYRLVTTMPRDALSDEVAINIDPATDDLYVVWSSLDDPNSLELDVDIYYARYIGVFGPRVLVSEGELFDGFAKEPDVLFDPMSATLHVIWSDESLIPGTGADQDIFYYGFRIE